MTVSQSLTTLVGAVLIFSSSNTLSQVDRAEWREEVMLASDEVIVVGRAATRDKKGTPVSRRGPLRSYEIDFPDGFTKWRSDGSTQPLAVEIVDGKSYAAVAIHSRALCAKYENPEGSVVFFRWENGNWNRIVRSEYPSNGRINLLWVPWGRTSKQDISGLVGHVDKHLRRGNEFVNLPINERVINRARDACELYKKL